jgi:hypothetical protein
VDDADQVQSGLEERAHVETSKNRTAIAELPAVPALLLPNGGAGSHGHDAFGGVRGVHRTIG